MNFCEDCKWQRQDRFLGIPLPWGVQQFSQCASPMVGRKDFVSREDSHGMKFCSSINGDGYCKGFEKK